MRCGRVKDNDWTSVRKAIQILSSELAPTASPTFAGTTLSGLTASRLLSTDSSKGLASVTTGTSLSFSAGTLNTIQGIRTTDSPTFAGLTLTGLSGVLKATAGVVSGSATLDDVADGTNYERVAANQLSSGIYINATTVVKGIASFSSSNFSVTDGVVSLAAGGGLAHDDLTNLAYADAGHTGFEPTVTKGNLTAGSSKITIGGTGTGAVIGAGASVDVAEGNLTHANLGSLQGGTTAEYYHLTSTEHGYVSGVNAQSVLTTASPTFATTSLVTAAAVSALVKWTATDGYGEWAFQEGTTYKGFIGAYGSAYSVPALRDSFIFTAATDDLGSIYFRTKTSTVYNTRMSISNAGAVNIPGLTASRLVATDGSKNLSSTTAASWVTGTANRVTVTDDGDGTITLSGPQDLHTGASPQFAGLSLTGGITLTDVLETMVASNDNNSIRGIWTVYSDTASHDGQFSLRHARGTAASPTVTSDGNKLGEFIFWGYSGVNSAFKPAVRIVGYADGEWDSGGDTTDNPGRLTFETCPDGSNLTVERVRITGTGLMGVGSTGPQAQVHIDQSSTTAAIPVLTLDQADVSEEFVRFIGTAAAATLTQGIVNAADVSTATVAGYVKVYVQDDGNQITDSAYYLPVYTLA